jgi:hypothetical protein
VTRSTPLPLQTDASRARVQVEPDWKPAPSEPREPKPLKKTRGFRTSPAYLREQFRFAVLHEFGGRCILADYYDGRHDEQADLRNDARGTDGRDAAADQRDAQDHIDDAVVASADAHHGRDDAWAETCDGPQLPRVAHVCEGPLDPAHIIPRQTLRKLGLPETVVYDHRNGVAACRKAHRRNDDGLERFPYELLPPSVFDFARDLELTYLLDKLYPQAAERSRETA